MFTTHSQQSPASAVASSKSLKASLTKTVEPINDNPEESRYRVLHDLWVDRIAVRAKKQGFRWEVTLKGEEAPQDFSPRR